MPSHFCSVLARPLIDLCKDVSSWLKPLHPRCTMLCQEFIQHLCGLQQMFHGYHLTFVCWTTGKHLNYLTYCWSENSLEDKILCVLSRNAQLSTAGYHIKQWVCIQLLLRVRKLNEIATCCNYHERERATRNTSYIQQPVSHRFCFYLVKCCSEHHAVLMSVWYLLALCCNFWWWFMSIALWYSQEEWLLGKLLRPSETTAGSPVQSIFAFICPSGKQRCK